MNLHNFFGAWLTALGLLSWSLPSTVSPAMAQGAAPAAPLAYVSNEKSGTISIIDTRTDQVLGELRAGSKPRSRSLPSTSSAARS